MAHVLSCACGQRLRVPPHLLGGQAKCSACGAVVDIPVTLEYGCDDSTRSTTPSQIRFGCPYCGRRLTANGKSAGRILTCPGCDEGVVVPKRSNASALGNGPTADIVELLDEAERERAKEQATKSTCSHCAAEVASSDQKCPECRRELSGSPSPARRKQINRTAQLAVGWGISLVYYGLILSLATLVVSTVGVVIRNETVIGASRFLQLVVIPMGLAGKVLCIAAPARYGQQFAVIATLAEVVALIVWLHPPFTEIRGFDPTTLLANVASLVSYLLFLTFLVSLSSGMKQSGAAAAAGAVMDRTVQLTFLPPFLFALVGVFGTFVGSYVIRFVVLAAILFCLVLTVLWLVAYLQLLSFLKVRLLD